jgi:hypothetical protein
MNANISNKTVKKSKSQSGGILSWIDQYDSLVIFGSFGILIVLTVLYTGLFQAGPIVRDNVVFNTAMAVLLSAGFIYVIFHFMGAQLSIFGKSFDIGMFIYIFIVFFVIFVMGN